MSSIVLSSGESSLFAANWLNVLIAVIFILGGSGGVTAWFKLRKENSKILVDAAKGAVVVQSSVIDDLRTALEDQKKKSENENEELRAEIAELRTHLTELNSLRAEVRELGQQNEVLLAENIMLKSQVKALSKMVHDQEQRKNGTKEA